MRSIKDAALAFDRACKAANVQYALIGGFAVMAWGQPRMTMTVDALVVLDQAGLEKFRAACEAGRLRVSTADLLTALREGTHATMFDQDSTYQVHAKPALTTEQVAEVGRAHAVVFPEGSLTIARPEDTIAHKLLIGAPHDVADARSIIVRQGDALDRAAMENVCARFGVTPKLKRLFAEIDRKH